MSSTNTAIEWTDKTWNPTVGCNKVSPGCKHCYAETITNRHRRLLELSPALDWTENVWMGIRVENQDYAQVLPGTQPKAAGVIESVLF